MANNKIIAKFQLDGVDKATNNIGELERSLEQARQEIKNVEIGSDAFEELARKIQTSESRVKTLNKQMEGLEPQQKAEAFLKMGEGIAGGFAAAQGAMGLMGIESENLEKIQVKVQSAIAIAMGVRMMAEGALNIAIAKRVVTEKIGTVTTALYTKVTKIATVSVKNFKKALVGIGFGMIIGLVSTLITRMQSLSRAKKDSKDKVDFLTQSYKDFNREIQESNRQLDIQLAFELEMAQATDGRGKLTAMLNKQMKLNNDQLKIEQERLKEANEFLQENNDMRTEQFLNMVRQRKEAEKNIGILNRQNEASETRINNIKIIALQEARANIESSKAIQERKEIEIETQALIDEGKQMSYDLSKELMFMQIDDANILKRERLEIQREEDLLKVQGLENRLELEKKINQKYDLLQQDRIDEVAQYEIDVERDKYQQIAIMIGALSGMFKQGTKQWKRLKIAETLISTREAVQKASTASYGIGPLGFILRIGMMAAALATGMAQVRAIRNTPIPEDTVPVTVFAQGGTIGGYGTGTTDNVPVMASAGEVIINSRSAQMYRPLLSSINQAGGGIGFANGGEVGTAPLPDMSNQIIKAYVVTDEMTESQDLLAKIRKRAEL